MLNGRHSGFTVHNRVRTTDSAGRLYRIDRASGEVIWRKPISTYTGVRGDRARATPVIAGEYLIVST